jgi:hypothetical protein
MVNKSGIFPEYFLICDGWIHHGFDGLIVSSTRRSQPARWWWVSHTCNSSYSGDRDQENYCSKPVWANSLWDPILKKPFTKMGWWSGLRCRPWVQATGSPKKKKKKRRAQPTQLLFLLHANIMKGKTQDDDYPLRSFTVKERFSGVHSPWGRARE